MIIQRLVLVTVLAVGAWAQETDNRRTWDVFNGRLWVTLSEPVKSAYVMGIWEGALAMNDTKALEAYNDKSTFSETARSIDLFYQEPANILIPVNIAMMLVTAKNNGATTADLDGRLTKIRRLIVQKDPPPEVTKN